MNEIPPKSPIWGTLREDPKNLKAPRIGERWVGGKINEKFGVW
jgi:hypothetical protein